MPVNRFTGAIATAQNQLFTTLDPLARRLRLPSGETIVLTDTVGFLHQLPHHLIEAFQATLEEARDAHLLLHVMDASHPLVLEHARAVDEVLAQLKLKDKPTVTVLNKCDRVQETWRLPPLAQAHRPAATISAKTGEGVEELCAAIDRELQWLLIEPTRLRVPLA